MRMQLYIIFWIIVGLFGCSNGPKKNVNREDLSEHIVRIEMNLSAYGVESDYFPSIDAKIDLSKGTSICFKSFGAFPNKDTTYSLTKDEMNSIEKLLKPSELKKLKKEYTVPVTDQPSSKIKIFTTKKTYIINDYGLEGDYPLKELYRIVYKY